MTPPLSGQRLQGILLILLCALIWAVTVTWCKWRLGDPLSLSLLTPGHFTLAEAAGLAGVGVLWCLLSHKQSLGIPWRLFPALLWVALTGSVLALSFFYLALEMTQQINATLLGHTQVVFIVLVGLILFGIRPRRIEWVSIPVVFVAAALITLRSWENVLAFSFDNLGDALVLTAAVLWALAGVFSQRLMRYLTGPQILAWRGILAVMVILLARGFYIYWRPEGPGEIIDVFDKLCVNQMFWSEASHRYLLFELAAYSALVGGGFLCYYLGLERLTVSEAATWELGTPFFAMVLAMVIHSEIPTLLQGIGGALLVATLWRLGRPDEIPGHLARGKVT